MQGFSVTPEQLETASNQLGNGRDQIQQINNQLLNIVRNLESVWQGEAYTQYQDWYNQWNQAADKFRVSLDSFVRATHDASRAYRETENAVKGMFNR